MSIVLRDFDLNFHDQILTTLVYPKRRELMRAFAFIEVDIRHRTASLQIFKFKQLKNFNSEMADNQRKITDVKIIGFTFTDVDIRHPMA